MTQQRTKTKPNENLVHIARALVAGVRGDISHQQMVVAVADELWVHKEGEVPLSKMRKDVAKALKKVGGSQ